MTNEMFNIFSTIGIALTFLASVAAVVVSIISLRTTYKSEKHTGYLNTITASRDRWSNMLRDNASLYFTQIARLCSGHETNLDDIYNELTRYHFAITLLLFKNDEELHNNMSAVRDMAFQIVDQQVIINQQYKKAEKSQSLSIAAIESSDIVQNCRKKMYELRISILNNYQCKIFNEIRRLIENEWRKQQNEAINM